MTLMIALRSRVTYFGQKLTKFSFGDTFICKKLANEEYFFIFFLVLCYSTTLVVLYIKTIEVYGM